MILRRVVVVDRSNGDAHEFIVLADPYERDQAQQAAEAVLAELGFDDDDGDVAVVTNEIEGELAMVALRRATPNERRRADRRRKR